MSLTPAEVEKIARLARLSLSEDEVATYGEQLSAILDYEARIGQLDLADVAPAVGVLKLENVLRDDIIEPSLPLEDALYNAAAQANSQFLIQAVLDE